MASRYQTSSCTNITGINTAATTGFPAKYRLLIPTFEVPSFVFVQVSF